MTTASSTFPATENPISEAGAWVSGPGSMIDVQTVAGNVRGTTILSECGARYVAATFVSDHSSQVTVASGWHTTGDLNISACTRMQSNTDASCYLLETQGPNTMNIFRVSDSGGSLTFSQLGASFTAGFTTAAGSVLKLDSTGSTHSFIFGGVTQGTRTDATLTGGQPGIRLFTESTSASLDLISDWTGADAVVAAGSAPPSRQMRLNPALLSM